MALTAGFIGFGINCGIELYKARPVSAQIYQTPTPVVRFESTPTPEIPLPSPTYTASPTPTSIPTFAPTPFDPKSTPIPTQESIDDVVEFPSSTPAIPSPTQTPESQEEEKYSSSIEIPILDLSILSPVESLEALKYDVMRSISDILNPNIQVTTRTPTAEPSTPAPTVLTLDQANVSQIPDVGLGKEVQNAYCKIIVPRSVLTYPTLANWPNHVFKYQHMQPGWVVDIDRLHIEEGQRFCEGEYRIWARIDIKGNTNQELDQGWFLIRDNDEISALCGKWLVEGEDTQKSVNQHLALHPELSNFDFHRNGTYTIHFRNQREALLWTYILSEGNYDPSIQALPQPFMQQQYDLADGAILNVLLNDMKIHDDSVAARLASGRYYGVLYGNPFNNLYIQSLNHPGNVVVSAASINPERAARVRAIIDLQPQIIPDGLYIYIINPTYDHVNMVEVLNLLRADLVGPIGLHCYGSN